LTKRKNLIIYSKEVKAANQTNAEGSSRQMQSSQGPKTPPTNPVLYNYRNVMEGSGTLVPRSLEGINKNSNDGTNFQTSKKEGSHCE
jgi:hypothetical protein